MTAAQQFKEDPIEFMENNVVLVRCGYGTEWKKTLSKHFGSSLIGGVMTLTLKAVGRNYDKTAYHGRYGYRVPLYMLVNGRNADRNEQIAAYWCPYEDNKTFGVMLGNAAKYMFTAEMSGCSLGLGSPCQDGSILVYHSNVKSATGNQSSAQMTELAKVGATQKVLTPGEYRSTEFGQDAINITPFGVREKSKWKLHYQMYKYTAGNKISLMGVKPVTGIVESTPALI
ncbi:hypothetical protein [Rhodospira trueperi]|uniref:Uncharacterized protein n=1 Tax=Rhodospira trueperi TaxID=69960 RepID=A0A1G6WJM1_9PROT|nr:hypothetical protein [Rhodospira trueperi]SDD66072.1 hypothetical protein SAMN05421720_101181 [Rhodospira trueperi]